MVSKRLSRRAFLKLLSLGFAAGGSAWLEACARQSLLPPTATLTAASTIRPTSALLEPTSTRPAPTYSNTETLPPSTDSAFIVRSHHSGVWDGEELSRPALRQMLDASVARLTRIEDSREAWASLFKPHERVAIKVNGISRGCTHPALALVVTECLQDAGVPADQITIYDRSSNELSLSGFPVSSSGLGVRCLGNDGQFVDGWEVAKVPVRLSQRLMDADALINIPILKAFSIGGLSFAQKNHYGTIHNPGSFHGSNFTAGVTGVNNLEPIRSRTRLIIGDVLTQQTRQDLTNYVVVGGPEALLVGTDPVAADAIGLQMAVEVLEPLALNLGSVKSQAETWLQAGADLGLGTSDPAKIKLEEIQLTGQAALFKGGKPSKSRLSGA